MGNAVYATVSVAPDGRRKSGELRVPVLTSINEIKGQAQVEGEWLFVRRLTMPTGTWVWTPEGDQTTVREMQRHFGWSHV